MKTFSCSVVSDSLWPHGLQHIRLPCPSPTPGACSNSHPSSQWCHPIISSSVVPFSSYLQSFPASGSFPMSQFFASGDQGIGVSASASVLPMNIHNWFPLGLTDLISLQSKGLSKVFPNTTIQNINSSVLSFLYRKRTYSLLLFIEREPITSAKRAYWFQVILRKYWFPMLYCSYKLSVLHRNSNKEVSKMHYPDFLTDLAVA